jgi:hypothetical protein
MIHCKANPPYENEKGGERVHTGPVMGRPWETLNQGVCELVKSTKVDT